MKKYYSSAALNTKYLVFDLEAGGILKKLIYIENQFM